jgi:hypothetical protein
VNDELLRAQGETIRALSESLRVQSEAIQLLEHYVNEQLTPVFCIVTALVTVISSKEQQNLLATLQKIAAKTDSSAPSPYAKAAEMVSQLVSGGGGEPAESGALKLILGGKKDPA